MLVSIGNHELLLQTVSRIQQMYESEVDRAIQEHRILEGLQQQVQDAQSQLKKRLEAAEKNMQHCQKDLEDAQARAASAADQMEELENK